MHVVASEKLRFHTDKKRKRLSLLTPPPPRRGAVSAVLIKGGFTKPHLLNQPNVWVISMYVARNSGKAKLTFKSSCRIMLEPETALERQPSTRGSGRDGRLGLCTRTVRKPGPGAHADADRRAPRKREGLRHACRVDPGFFHSESSLLRRKHGARFLGEVWF